MDARLFAGGCAVLLAVKPAAVVGAIKYFAVWLTEISDLSLF